MNQGWANWRLVNKGCSHFAMLGITHGASLSRIALVDGEGAS